jgi:SAM-dependent methyltransferase
MKYSQAKVQRNKTRPCPVCKANSPLLYFRQNFSERFDGSLLSGYDVVVCRECGFGYANHIPSQFLIDRYYKILSKYEQEDLGNIGSSFNTDRFQAIANFIVQTLPSKQISILEVGCATGELLGCLKEKGCSNVIGLDPAPYCSQVADRLYGVRVEVGNIFNLRSLARTFDYVIMIGVMEHIHDLARAFENLRSILSPSGRLLIEVPDVIRFACYPDAPFQQFSTEHINFFSPISLENLLGVNGFRKIASAKFERNQSTSTIMPVVTGLFELCDEFEFQVSKDFETGSSLDKYIHQSRKVHEEIRRIIDNLAQEKKPVIVWGVGTHTLRLLSESSLGEANIAAFVDSNSKYWGMDLNGVPVLAPQSIIARKEAILISSRVYQDVIERTIRDELGMQNEIIKLYPM